MLCSLPIIASLLASCAPAPPTASGYVEGDFVLVAPIETARLEEVAVARGDTVAQGAPLLRQERRDAEIAVARSEAAVARARAELADLRRGARPEEIAVAEAEVDKAAADLQEAETELKRVEGLFQRNVVPQAQLDAARTRRTIAAAVLREARARLDVLRLPARAGRIEAAEAALREAEAALEAAQWKLSQRTLAAPVGGTVADVYRFAGDIAGPQAPALSILPPDGIKLRFFVPEAKYAQIALGDSLAFSCDGCPAGLSATVSYMSDSPEFTPPVIYSVEARQKLVYLAEARPDDAAAAAVLKPGQIVDVVLPGAAP